MSELHGVKKKLAFDFVICAYCSYEMLYQNHINGFKRAFIKRKGKKRKLGGGWIYVWMDGFHMREGKMQMQKTPVVHLSFNNNNSKKEICIANKSSKKYSQAHTYTYTVTNNIIN